MLDRRWVQKNVLGLTDKEIIAIQEGRIKDKLDDGSVEGAGAEAGGEEAGGGDEGGGLFSGDKPEGDQLLTAEPRKKYSFTDDEDTSDEDDDFVDLSKLSINDPDAPLKAQQVVNKYKPKKQSRGPLTTHMPDFKTMVTHGRSQDSMRRPYGDDYLKPAFEGMDYDEGDSYVYRDAPRPVMTPEMKSVFKSLVNILDPKGGVLLEGANENEGKAIPLDEYEAGEIDES
jgi:hypothetical protein